MTIKLNRNDPRLTTQMTLMIQEFQIAASVQPDVFSADLFDLQAYASLYAGDAPRDSAQGRVTAEALATALTREQFLEIAFDAGLVKGFF